MTHDQIPYLAEQRKFSGRAGEFFRRAGEIQRNSRRPQELDVVASEWPRVAPRRRRGSSRSDRDAPVDSLSPNSSRAMTCVP